MNFEFGLKSSSTFDFDFGAREVGGASAPTQISKYLQSDLTLTHTLSFTANYPKTLSNNLTFSQDISTANDKPQDATNNLTFSQTTDVQSSTTTTAYNMYDRFTFNQSAEFVGIWPRDASNNLTLSDAAASVFDYLRDATNNLTLGDVASSEIVNITASDLTLNQELTHTYTWSLKPANDLTLNHEATSVKDLAEAPSNNLTLNHIGSGNVAPFISTWNTEQAGTSNSQQIKLPLVENGTYNFTVDWGDDTTDTITSWDQAETTHTYPSSGNYETQISGTINGWSFNDAGDKLKISNISQWGNLSFGSTEGQFYGCENLTCNATDAPDLSSTNNLYICFRDTSFNGFVNDWNTANVTDMRGMFRDTPFNQSVNSWNTANVTDMSRMFLGASSFNQSVNNWNTANVTNMAYMFYKSSFNQSVNDWNTANVTDMRGMFRDTPFNQSVNSWNTANVHTMRDMFNGSSFNKTVEDWNVTSLEDATEMFADVTLTTTNYSNILINWEAQDVLQEVPFHGGDSTYNTDGATARQSLSDDHNWTIDDGGAA